MIDPHGIIPIKTCIEERNKAQKKEADLLIKFVYTLGTGNLKRHLEVLI